MPQISENGYISFNDLFLDWSPERLPIDEHLFVAPFWADFSVSRAGKIYYRQTTDPDLLDRATDEIKAAFPVPEEFSATSLVITTWDAVGLDLIIGSQTKVMG